MKHKDLSCSDWVSQCDWCGKKFKPNDTVIPVRELNAVFCEKPKCQTEFIKRNESEPRPA